MAKFLIGSREYASKKAAMDAVRSVLYGYPLGARVTRPEDEALLRDLLALHKDAEAKEGPGVAHFDVRENDYRTRGFWAVRVDGTETDWSFVVCFNPPTQEQEVFKALRQEIKDQIEQFRSAAYGGRESMPCAVTGVPVPWTASHVDHERSFRDLAIGFFCVSGTRPWALEVNPTVDGCMAHALRDRDVAEAWRAFHATHARLRVVSRHANLSVLRRKA